MNKEEIKMAYFAGVMDGDGSFSIGSLSNASANVLYFPLLQCNSWRSFVFLLKESFGGTIFKGRPHICKDGTEGHALFRWRVRSQNNVRPVLEKLIPFLKIKKDRAIFLLDFIERNPFVRGRTLEKSIIASRQADYLKMIQFNDWKGCYKNITKKLVTSVSEDPLFWSYLAGLMDTDGSFSVKKQVINKGTDVKNPRYIAFILLSMTDSRAINYLRENCSLGKFYIPKNKSTNAGFHFQFGIYNKSECIQFVKKIIPFMHSKKENAEELLYFCENIKNTKYCKDGIPQNEINFREGCYQKLCSLNKYGVFKPSLIDLEVQKQDDRAEGESHRERLNEMASVS